MNSQFNSLYLENKMQKYLSKLIYTLIVTLFITQFFLDKNIYAKWEGPTSGPPAQMSKKIIFISSDLRNGGVSAIFRSFKSATKYLNWSIQILDGQGQIETIRKKFIEAVNARPHAIVLGGFQPDENSSYVLEAKKNKIILVGWHASEKAGATKDLFVNVSTNALDVAKIAANFVINDSKGKAGVVIFNDNQFEIANAKTNHMKEIINACKNCKLLSIENVLISNAEEEIPSVVPLLNEKFGKSLTHILAINDIYFDNIHYSLASIGRKDIKSVSAGDGSIKALRRIRFGSSSQIATVAEPLNSQGWQLADELNRAFAEKESSTYISKPILVTKKLLDKLKDNEIDSDLNYEKYYLKIWQIKK
ncbi:substrate-binding domain-containing protein [Fluviispira sanaruensis]|uniref:ABC transporter substrate-binding protein n=1 Tax=Fluviispira sanaruensis TaxID=2493639 RepID=A0A4P2VRV3_FLUSA|nr:substrate-binding domain-containing protein [Fluviispira sanaruensis]BBH51935.1 ABC transporter substrate-binding protein [Fluviispira sanaruensis]